MNWSEKHLDRLVLGKSDKFMLKIKLKKYMNCQWEYIVVFILIYEMTFITFHKTSIDSFMLFFSYNANNSLNKTYTFRLKNDAGQQCAFSWIIRMKKANFVWDNSVDMLIQCYNRYKAEFKAIVCLQPLLSM